MKKINVRELRKYLKNENEKPEDIEKIINYMEDFLLYGNKKPYMSTQTYNKLLLNEINKFNYSNKKIRKSFIIKFEFDNQLSWKQVRQKLKYGFTALENCAGKFEYYIWSKAKSNIEFEIYSCLQFYNTRYEEDFVEEVLFDAFFSTEITIIKKTTSTIDVINSLNTLFNQKQKQDSNFTWYKDKSKIFIQSKNFG